MTQLLPLSVTDALKLATFLHPAISGYVTDCGILKYHICIHFVRSLCRSLMHIDSLIYSIRTEHTILLAICKLWPMPSPHSSRTLNYFIH